MANTDIYPYGQSEEMPAGYPIANDLDTNDAQQALSAAMGYKLARTHWNGKKWYGFGTSITDTESYNAELGDTTGKYAPYLAALSGMTFVNKGIGGSGITKSSDQRLYNSLMSFNAQDADLITLEVGANDGGAALGTPYDGLPGEAVTDNTTFCGALNKVLTHLLSTTTAQIVVICSPHGRYRYQHPEQPYYGNETSGSDNHTTLDRDEIIRKVCELNAVYYIPAGAACGMGRARTNANNLLVRDQVHQTNLGGYNFAQAIWSQLKNIPLFYKAIPT